MDSIPQENGLIAFERWRKRPPLEIHQKIFDHPRVVEIVGTPQSGRTFLTRQMIKKALDPNKDNEVLVIDCENGINGVNLKLEEKQLERVHLYRVFDWNDYQTTLALIPQILCQSPLINLILVDGLDSTYMLKDRNKQERTKLNCDRFMRQQISRLGQQILEAYPSVCCALTRADASDLEVHNTIRVTIEADKCRAKFVQNAVIFDL